MKMQKLSLKNVVVASAGPPGETLVTIDGVNHLFVPAETGDVDEYAVLPDRKISPKLAGALVPWLREKLRVAPAGAGR